MIFVICVINCYFYYAMCLREYGRRKGVIGGYFQNSKNFKNFWIFVFTEPRGKRENRSSNFVNGVLFSSL